jgi:hypothetical protein
MNSPLKSNSYQSDGGSSASEPSAAEVTLRLIAHLPAPDGLADRIQAGLSHAPQTARLIAWPVSFRPINGWMHGGMARGAAAAAIVMVVAGGGWRVYSRVQPPVAARVIVMPSRVSPTGGFSTGGAMRTPETLHGPVLKHPAVLPDDSSKPANPTATAGHRVRSRVSKTGKAAAPVSDKVTSVPHP